MNVTLYIMSKFKFIHVSYLFNMSFHTAQDILEMITCFTYYPKPLPITPYMWSILPQILSAHENYACDYISSMIHPIDNFICNGTEVFLSMCQPFHALEAVLAICRKVGLPTTVRKRRMFVCCSTN